MVQRKNPTEKKKSKVDWKTTALLQGQQLKQSKKEKDLAQSRGLSRGSLQERVMCPGILRAKSPTI